MKEIKLKWFQIKICYRILVTNNILHKLGVVDSSNKCNFCQKEKDTIEHYLYFCEHLLSFWIQLETFLKEKCGNCERFRFNFPLILFGTDEITETDEILDLVILLGKVFVYKCRITKTKPNIQHFLKELCWRYKMEKYAHTMEMKQAEFKRKWYPYLGILQLETFLIDVCICMCFSLEIVTTLNIKLAYCYYIHLSGQCPDDQKLLFNCSTLFPRVPWWWLFLFLLIRKTSFIVVVFFRFT